MYIRTYVLVIFQVLKPPTTIIIGRVHSNSKPCAVYFHLFSSWDRRRQQAHPLNFSHIQSMDILEAEHDFVLVSDNNNGFFQITKTPRLIAQRKS